jgi:hypothetical protein
MGKSRDRAAASGEWDTLARDKLPSGTDGAGILAAAGRPAFG